MGIKEFKNSKDQILVVDDQPENLKIIASKLTPEYTLSIANNGMNALKILEKSIPDLILLDIMMPEMDGFEVCKRIRENKRTKDVPIIFLTAKTALEDIIKGFDSGAVDYITKPFNPAEMSVRVKNHLNLYHAKQEIEQINKEKDKFFSIIAHDLRSPFIAIVGFSKLLLEKANRNDLKGVSKYAQIILQSSEHVLDLQMNLMDWAQAQTGRMEFNPEHFEIDKLINEVALLYQDIARNKSILIKEELLLNILVNADKAMISTVIRNLVSNAIKYGAPDAPVRTVIVGDATDVRFGVTNSGPTIERSALEQIFDPFTRCFAAGLGNVNHASPGLGLFIVREVARAHGGEVAVHSAEGVTVFDVLLPRGHGALGYVVLFHDRESGPHFDWMFEGEEGLRTWATAERLMLDQADAATATELPLHRAAYLEYEGPVSGNRGSVRRVERGTFRVLQDATDLYELEVAGDRAGRLIFRRDHLADRSLWRIEFRPQINGEGTLAEAS